MACSGRAFMANHVRLLRESGRARELERLQRARRRRRASAARSAVLLMAQGLGWRSPSGIGLHGGPGEPDSRRYADDGVAGLHERPKSAGPRR